MIHRNTHTQAHFVFQFSLGPCAQTGPSLTLWAVSHLWLPLPCVREEPWAHQLFQAFPLHPRGTMSALIIQRRSEPTVSGRG